MNGIDEVLVVFDTSGSFHELGKQHMLTYLGDAIANAEGMAWFQTKLRMYTWNDAVQESLEIPPELSGHDTAEIRALRGFLEKVSDQQAVLLISDGLFGFFRDRRLMSLTKGMGQRFQVIAAGYDANLSALKKMTENVHLAEDMMGVLRLLAEKSWREAEKKEEA